MSSSPYFKIGDTFLTPARFYNTETDEGIEITSSIIITSRITTKLGDLIADCVVTPYADQVANRGWFLLSVEDTTGWKNGEAICDIKIEQASSIKHSETFCFKIIKSVTP